MILRPPLVLLEPEVREALHQLSTFLPMEDLEEPGRVNLEIVHTVGMAVLAVLVEEVVLLMILTTRILGMEDQMDQMENPEPLEILGLEVQDKEPLLESLANQTETSILAAAEAQRIH